MHIPLPIRLTLFYALVVGIALWSFGYIVDKQAKEQAYHDLDTTLSNRAASVRLGKDILASYPGSSGDSPHILNSVDALGTGGVAIEVLDSQFRLLATTTKDQNIVSSGVASSTSSPIPWDAHAIHFIISHNGNPSSFYSTITYQGQRVRVYTLLNTDIGTSHFIQTARSEQDIEQTLSDTRLLLLRGAMLVMFFTLVGGWTITWGVLAIVRRMTQTAQQIRVSQDFGKRVSSTALLGRDELTTLADTFNQMLASLQAAHQQQQRFIADASHELRAPITSISCNLDLLAKASHLPAEEAREALLDARIETARMGRLVNDLLVLAHTDAIQKYDVSVRSGSRNIREVDMDSLLLEVFRQYRPSSQDESQYGPRLLLRHIAPIQVRGDADLLKQAIVALVDNALKYTPREGCVTLSLVEENAHAVLQIDDTGLGISQEEVPHIFERFYRSERTRAYNSGGSGLGLSIVQNIVQAHEGNIEVESVYDKGSTFTLRLPMIK